MTVDAPEAASRTTARPGFRPGTGRAVRVAALVVVGGLGLVVAFWHISRQTPYVDEFTYIGSGWDYVHGALGDNLQHPPTAKYLFGLVQLVTGQGVLGPRLLSAAASFGTGLVLFAWLRRTVGHWGALLAAGLWWLTPRADSPTWTDVATGTAVRIDRLALLEPLMTFFAVAAVAAAWHWAVRGRPDRGPWHGWWWMAASGALLALSVTSKVSTAVLVLALVLVPVLFRRWVGLLTGGVAAAVAFTVVFVALYAPVGGLRAIEFMVAFQGKHDADGHEISLLGRNYQFAPWWTNPVRVVEGVGWPTVVVLLIGIVAALVIRPDRLVAVLGVSLGLLVVFYCTANVALPHYYQVWMPWAIALAAVGLVRLARLRPPVTTVVALVAVAVTVVTAAVVVRTVADARLTGFARIDSVLAARGVPTGERLLVSGASQQSFGVFVGARGATQQVTHGDYGVLVDGVDPRFPMEPEIRDLLRTHRQDFETFRVDALRVWVVRDGLAVQRRGDTVTLVPAR
jgi:4-amino-4-deoxy-L-arabinose transferase-like glycosyltransferase